MYDLVRHIRFQANWSLETFGPGEHTHRIVAHIRRELAEVEAAPADLEEWIDVVLLALDGAWRTGASPEEVAAMLGRKLSKNMARQWPDWRTVPEGTPVEHI